jgi:hypothetical protein
MKVGIITVYNSENCGSFLQAYSLFSILKEKGHEPYFLRNIDYLSDSSHHLLGMFITICKHLVRLDFSSAMNVIHRHRLFSRELRYASNQIVDLQELNRLDACIIGSDTLWNLYDSFFLRNIDDYTGKKLKIPFFYYAISGGNTTYNDVKKNGVEFSPILKASGISVRDKGTCDLVKEITNEFPEVVLDPTLIVNRHIFAPFETENVKEPVLVIYAFGRINIELQSNIRKFADERGLKVVSFGKKYDCSDIVVPNSPSYFISYLKNAKFIVTNTFHGCLFSVIFNKQFVVITDMKDKINDFLERIDLCDRIVDAPQIVEVLNAFIDYGTINNELNLLKNKSIKYLLSMLNRN